MTKPTITPQQADREAAIAMLRIYAPKLVGPVQAGTCDSAVLVQAFANHAQQARLEGYQQGVADEQRRIVALVEKARDRLLLDAIRKGEAA